MENEALRKEIIETAIAFNETGLSIGASGNLSARTDKGYLITPTCLAYQELKPEDLIEMNLQGEQLSGDLKPSSEWRFHQDVFIARSDNNAIIHVHSPYATSISCTRQSIPAFHYMIAIAGGDNIRCADYATFGTEALSKNAVKALADRKACLLANHGMLALGENILSAFKLAQEIENLAKQYWLSQQLGDPVILDGAEMKLVLEKFKTYGK